MDPAALYNLSYGLYVLSSKINGEPCGCIVNTAIQQTDQPLRISVTVNKANRTCDAINASGMFCVSVLDTGTNFKMIRRFGFQSSRDVDKFDGLRIEQSRSGLPVITDNTCAYIEAKVVHKLDQGTHIMFLGTVTDAKTLSGTTPLTYAYYHSNIKPKPAQTASGGYRCRICGYIHEGDTLPADYVCPLCKHGVVDFEPLSVSTEINNINNIKGEKIMKKFVCSVCGYVHEGPEAPEFCPQCKVPASKFVEQVSGETVWADEHVVGVAQGVDMEIIEGLRANFVGECSEVGMYLAMARVAHREGYPEIGLYWEKAAYEEAEHAAKFAELLGEVVTDSTKKNLAMRVEAESGACDGKKKLAARAKELGLDAIHDTVHEMAKDEARHGRAFEGLLKRYFG